MAEKGNNAHDDLQLRLGLAPSPTEPTGKKYVCSHCKRTFASLQALGGHQTAHRKEMEELRKSYQAAPSGPSIADGAKISDDASVDLMLSLQPGGVDLNLKL
jgi:C2H2-type zinc finger